MHIQYYVYLSLCTHNSTYFSTLSILLLCLHNFYKNIFIYYGNCTGIVQDNFAL